MPTGLLGTGTAARRQPDFPFSRPNGAWAFTGRAALFLGLPALGLPPGAEILVPAYFHGVEIETLRAAGYRLRFYRLSADFQADLNHIEELLTPAAAALFAIHYIGFPQRRGALLEFCRQHNLKLIEDCALALYSRDEHGPLGNLGDLAIYSVYKTLPLPHGGFVVTKDDYQYGGLKAPPFAATAAQLKDLLHFGLEARGWQGVERCIKGGSRLWQRSLGHVVGWKREELVAAGHGAWDPRMLAYGVSRITRHLAQRHDPDVVIARRRENYLRLAAGLQGCVNTPAPFHELPAGVCPLFYPILVPDKLRLQQALLAQNIQTVNLWQDSHPACPADLAATVAVWRQQLLELPIHQDLGPEQIDRLAAAVLAASV